MPHRDALSEFLTNPYLYVLSSFFAAMKQGLLRLPETVDGFLSFELGTDLKLAAGQNHPAGKNRSIAWSASFASVADYERYNESKEHVTVVNDLIKPIIVPGSRAAIQYEYE